MKRGGGGYFNLFYGCNLILILLVTEGRMQNFKTLAQPLWENLGGVLLVLVVTTGKQSRLLGLAWDGSLTKKKCKRSNQAFLISHKLFVFENKLLINIKEGKMSVNIFSFALDLF